MDDTEHEKPEPCAYRVKVSLYSSDHDAGRVEMTLDIPQMPADALTLQAFVQSAHSMLRGSGARFDRFSIGVQAMARPASPLESSALDWPVIPNAGPCTSNCPTFGPDSTGGCHSSSSSSSGHSLISLADSSASIAAEISSVSSCEYAEDSTFPIMLQMQGPRGRRGALVLVENASEPDLHNSGEGGMTQDMNPLSVLYGAGQGVGHFAFWNHVARERGDYLLADPNGETNFHVGCVEDV